MTADLEPHAKVEPPVFPLSKEAFAFGMRTGHGRIRQHVELHGTTGHEDAIRDAVFHCRVYDSQLEGFRGDWLAPLCQAVGFEQEVLDWEPEEEELMRQRAAIVACFEGFPKEELWQAIEPYARRAEDHAGLLCVSSSMKVDPKKALLRFAKMEAAHTKEQGYDFADGMLLWEYEQVMGERESGWRLLESASERDEDLREYCRLVRAAEAAREDSPKRVKRKAPPFEKVREFILNGPGTPGRFRYWGKLVDAEQRKALQDSLPDTLDDTQTKRWLATFERTGFPVVEERFLALLRHADEEIRRRAAICLGHHEHASLAKCARDLMDRGEWLLASELLVKNGGKESVDRFLGSLPLYEEDLEIHWLCFQLRDGMKANPAFRDMRAALYFYEHNPCTICREDLLEILVEWGTLPDWIAEECRLDVAEDVRRFVAKLD